MNWIQQKELLDLQQLKAEAIEETMMSFRDEMSKFLE